MNIKTRHRSASARQYSATRHARRHITFSCEAPTAEGVWLVGDFNRWDLAATPMRRMGGGHWIATLRLNAGSYSYLFIVDGNLALDPNASVTTGNEQISRITIN
jgi:1,4-alpha-glucan branching enzyme